jgi:hypothetical protein
VIYESDNYVGSDLNGDSLSHHGVPKQKWGVRNGPPYPIKRGSTVHYNVGKMTDKTKAGLKKAGKIVGNAAKSARSKVSSSFMKWKESKKADLAVMPTDSKLLKEWQKKQLRISNMTNQELQQRIDRKRLEETYKHALRGDFSDPKTWGKSAKDAKSAGGKKAADTILGKIGYAAVDGLAKGLTNKIETKMTEKAKAKVARREARRDAIDEVLTEAAKERAQYKADYKNERWKERQDMKRNRRNDDGAMDAVVVGDPGFQSNRQSRDYSYYYTPTNSTGITTSNGSSNYYYVDPDDWRIR